MSTPLRRICIVGAGAIGGLIGTRLAALPDTEVSAIARGDTLQALREHGWRLSDGRGLQQHLAHAVSERAGELGPQDLVVIAVKAPALGAVVAGMAPLLAPHTIVLPAMNGVPWWFCEGRGDVPGGPIESVDPGGCVSQAIAFGRVLGCVVHASCALEAPGHVINRMGKGLIVGEPLGGHSERSTAVAALLECAGFDVTLSLDVRRDVWYKLWGNLTMNPVSAITGATSDQVLADPLVRGFCSSAMREAAALGSRLGCAIDQAPEQRHAITERLGAFKTSMLQDVEAGRAIELDAIVGAVHELGQRLGEPTPTIDALLGLSRLFGRTHGLYPQA